MLATTFDLDYVDTEDEGSKLLPHFDNKWSDIPKHLNCHNIIVKISKTHIPDT